jgi:hypothetical protein
VPGISPGGSQVISLRIINAGVHDEQFHDGHEDGHASGLRLLRVAEDWYGGRRRQRV